MLVFPSMVLVDDQTKHFGEFLAAEALVGTVQTHESPAGVKGSAGLCIEQLRDGLAPIMKAMEAGSLDSLDDFRRYLGQHLARTAATDFVRSMVGYPAEMHLLAFAREYLELEGGARPAESVNKQCA